MYIIKNSSRSLKVTFMFKSTLFEISFDKYLTLSNRYINANMKTQTFHEIKFDLKFKDHYHD